MFAIVQIPKHGDSIFTTGSGQGTIGRDREGVDVAGVTVVVGLELAFGDFPDLNINRDEDEISSANARSNVIHNRRRLCRSEILVI